MDQVFNSLVLVQVTRNEILGKGSFTHIPQVDGFGEGRPPMDEFKMLFSFTSENAAADNTSTIEGFFEPTEVSRAKLVSRLRSKPLSNIYNCVVELAFEANPDEFYWR